MQQVSFLECLKSTRLAIQDRANGVDIEKLRKKMYLPSKTWFLAAVEETETFDELFISLVWLNNWPPFGLREKSPTLEKKVHDGFIPLQAK